MAHCFRDEVIEASSVSVFVTLSFSQETISLDKANWHVIRRPWSEEQKSSAKRHIVLQPRSSIHMTAALLMA